VTDLVAHDRGRSAPDAGSAQTDSASRNNSLSVRRALAILSYVARADVQPDGLTLADLATGLNINKSTVLRLVKPLCDAHLVERADPSGRYRLGPETAYLGQTYLERLDLRSTAHDSMARLMEASQETVHLVVFDPPDVVYVDKVEAPQPIRMVSRIGSRQPVFCTAVGKAFLAHASEQIVRLVIDAGLPARTPRTITSEARLRAELDVIRAQGYAVDDVENEPDIRCVGGPIFDHMGTVVAAASISGPITRVTAQRVPELGRLVREATTEISQRLGGCRPTDR
jgi:IclR family acetate operon transcriptional repressor